MSVKYPEIEVEQARRAAKLDHWRYSITNWPVGTVFYAAFWGCEAVVLRDCVVLLSDGQTTRSFDEVPMLGVEIRKFPPR